jgi:hypothetical protein
MAGHAGTFAVVDFLASDELLLGGITEAGWRRDYHILKLGFL